MIKVYNCNLTDSTSFTSAWIKLNKKEGIPEYHYVVCIRKKNQKVQAKSSLLNPNFLVLTSWRPPSPRINSSQYNLNNETNTTLLIYIKEVILYIVTSWHEGRASITTIKARSVVSGWVGFHFLRTQKFGFR